MPKRCDTCGEPIERERVRAMPTTTTCTAHSRERGKLTLMVQDGKTAAYTVTVETNGDGGKERVRQALRAHRRCR